MTRCWRRGWNYGGLSLPAALRASARSSAVQNRSRRFCRAGRSKLRGFESRCSSRILLRPPLSLPIWRRGWDSNPRRACALAGFQDRCLKPLGHPSSAHQIYAQAPKCPWKAPSSASGRHGWRKCRFCRGKNLPASRPLPASRLPRHLCLLAHRSGGSKCHRHFD